MKVALIARSTFYAVPGGDTVQAMQTARELIRLGVDTEVKLANEPIAYDRYDLLHFFNIIRPADILYHSRKSGKPFVVSTILCNYSEYDKFHRRGIASLFRYLSSDHMEYLKTMARWILGRDHLSGKSYIWKGQRRSIIDILNRAVMILPNSESEYQRVLQSYAQKVKYMVVPNGADPSLFQYDPSVKKDPQLVLCVARIEGLKNQLTLIKALNGTEFNLVIIGAHAPNQAAYYHKCREIAAENISFIGHIPQAELVEYYRRAKVHILPSWFETTGLSSIEAALMGCSIVITNKGDAKEYFSGNAIYCDPGEPGSILAAVETAASAGLNQALRQKILGNYTWKYAAQQTKKAYQLAVKA